MRQILETRTLTFRDEFFQEMNQCDIHSKLIKYKPMMFIKTSKCAKAAGGISNSFQTVRGLRQGDEEIVTPLL